MASASIKAYHTLRVTWAMGEGAPAGFAHCTCMLISGRPVELRKRIADAMYGRLQELFRESVASGDAGLTLELREMDGETYRKG